MLMPRIEEPENNWVRAAQRAKDAVYEITLLVRGRKVVRQFPNEYVYRKWRMAFEAQAREPEVSGVEAVHGAVIYR